MEDSIMPKVHSQLEFCDDEQDDVVYVTQIYDSSPTQPLTDGGRGAYQVFDGISDRDVRVQIQNIDTSTELELLQEDANKVHKSKEYDSLHHHVLSSFPRQFCKERSLHCSEKLSYDNLTMVDHTGEVYRDTNTISDLVFDHGGNTCIFLLATRNLSHSIERDATLNMLSICLWKCCSLKLEARKEATINLGVVAVTIKEDVYLIYDSTCSKSKHKLLELLWFESNDGSYVPPILLNFIMP
ncbi:uncharacterized protein G2W53_003964 [Senna tora]|uniref:Uncharacterized protein n=1 Tax=Senna tora TaxID=362788 RepID=A0A835CHK2_9FABA|nr:uncharacterized protein G2W53_003964 [Senna tora]